MSISLGDIVHGLAGQYGVLVCFLIIFITGSQGLWVWGTQYRTALRERDEWQGRFLASLEAAEKLERVTDEKDRMLNALLAASRPAGTAREGAP